MSAYTVALFMHVSGAIGIFAGLSVWVFGVGALRRSQRVEQVRILAALIIRAGNLTVGSIIILGVAGFYMALTVWGIGTPWILVATVAFALLAPGGLLIIDPRVQAIAKQARDLQDGALPEALAARTRDPLLGTGLNAYVACLFGIVFVMTNKPAVVESMLAIAIAVAIGVLTSLPLWSSAHVQRRIGSDR